MITVVRISKDNKTRKEYGFWREDLKIGLSFYKRYSRHPLGWRTRTHWGVGNTGYPISYEGNRLITKPPIPKDVIAEVLQLICESIKFDGRRTRVSTPSFCEDL